MALLILVDPQSELECAVVLLKLSGSDPILKFGILVCSDGFPSITALEASTLEFSLVSYSSTGIFHIMSGIESLK